MPARPKSLPPLSVPAEQSSEILSAIDEEVSTLTGHSASYQPSKIQSQLDSLASAARSVNQLTDQLTKDVGKIEDALGAMNLGINAHVSAPCSGLDGRKLNLVLGYTKGFAGRWCFVIGEGTKDEAWPFRSAPREFPCESRR